MSSPQHEQKNMPRACMVACAVHLLYIFVHLLQMNRPVISESGRRTVYRTAARTSVFLFVFLSPRVITRRLVGQPANHVSPHEDVVMYGVCQW